MASNYVQAIPLYLKSDAAVAEYFTKFRDEIDQITGKYIVVIYPDEVVSGDGSRIVGAIDNAGSPRFPGLTVDDLPCLWIEDAAGTKIKVGLPDAEAEVKQRLRQLAAVVRRTRDAGEIERQMDALRDKRKLDEFRWLGKLMGDLGMDKSQERKLAITFGVIFVTAVLVIALFIPDPSGFQYTIFRIVLALAAGGFVSMTPGFIEAKVGNVIRAGGALAVFVVVYFFAPVALGTP